MNLAICSILVGLAAQAVSGELLLVYNINRHGARNVLPKGIQLQEVNLVGGPTLLPAGQRQCYNAGKKFRDRYIETTCGTGAVSPATSTCLYRQASQNDDYGLVGTAGFGNFNVEVRSSGLDRTILSALSFYTGVFPNLVNASSTLYLPTEAQIVPVYTQIDEQDIAIRGYTKCNTYQRRIRAWFSSEEFTKKEAESQALRNQVEALDSDVLNDTSLDNWFNIYDRVYTFKQYGVGRPVPDEVRQDAMFNKIKALADWLETRKMQSKLTGNLLGGVLLRQIRSAMQSVVSALDFDLEAIYYKIRTVSAHYNTQLGLLAAMKLDTYPEVRAEIEWFDKIPELASVLAFELYGLRAKNAGPNGSFRRFYVRLVAQDGLSPAYKTVPLPCSTPDAVEDMEGMPGVCTLARFLNFSAPGVLTPQEWCSECADVGPNALDVCKWVLYQGQADALGDSLAHVTRERDLYKPWAIGLTVVMCVIVAVVLFYLVVWNVRHWRTRHAKPAASSAAGVVFSDAVVGSGGADRYTQFASPAVAPPYAGNGAGVHVQMSHHQI